MSAPVIEQSSKLAAPDLIAKKRYRGKTTWHLRPRPSLLEVGPFEYSIDFIARLDLGPPELYEAKPGIDRGPVPRHSMLRECLFVGKWAAIPLIAQWAVLKYTKIKLVGWKAIGAQFAGYQFIFTLFAINVLRRCQRFMKHYGTLNEEERGRDIVPDSQQKRVILGLMAYSIVRGAGTFIVGKDRASTPRLSLWSPLKMGGFMIALDYFFYVYHRATHEFDSLWWIHRQHHATKSPTPMMSLWADEFQDSLEWAFLPFFAYQCVKLSFAELWMVSCFVLHIEANGHSGIRAKWGNPLVGPFLRLFDLDLDVEDHDLHHRHGRGGINYGKQTRVWDTLFGTRDIRVEDDKYKLRHK